MSPISSLVARLRDAFSSAVLGTTSPAAPALSGGLSLGSRSAITFGSLGIAVALAFAVRGIAGPFAAVLFYPALMMGALFGGPVLTFVALALSAAVTALFFMSPAGTALFALGLLVQAGLALGLRELFRESRRWGVRYRTLIDAVTAGLVISDPLGQIQRRQPEFERAIGMEWPAYQGMGWLSAVHPDDLKVAPGEPAASGGMLRRTIRLRNAKTGEWRWYQFRSVPIAGREGRPQELISVLFDVHRQRLANEDREIRAGEMRHRWKNLMTVITAIAASSQPQGDATVEAYVKKLIGRLQALSAAGDHAIDTGQESELGGLVRAALAPFIEENAPRILIEGPMCPISEATGAALALGMHELATNALKHGALSVPTGSVKVNWSAAPAGSGERIVIDWVEQNGPPVAKPQNESYGTRVIRWVPSREKEGAVDLDFRNEGLCCRISFVRELPVPRTEWA